MYALSTGCTLLLSGSMSDAVGSREIFLIGCFVQSVFSLGCGLALTGPQLVLARIVSGIATSFCLPSAMSLISENIPSGKMRNLAFAFMGGGQPIGFGLGIVIGGVLGDTIGWRWGFHTAAIANTLVFLLSMWQLPKRLTSRDDMWNRVIFGIDWFGAVTASAVLGVLSFALEYAALAC